MERDQLQNMTEAERVRIEDAAKLEGLTMQEALERCAGHMMQFGMARSLGESEQRVFGQACRDFTTTLAPYISQCFLQIYPEAAADLDPAAACAGLKKLGLQLSKEGGGSLVHFLVLPSPSPPSIAEHNVEPAC